MLEKHLRLCIFRDKESQSGTRCLRSFYILHEYTKKNYKDNGDHVWMDGWSKCFHIRIHTIRAPMICSTNIPNTMQLVVYNMQHHI